MTSANQYPGLTYVEHEKGADQEKFDRIAPAIAQALYYAYFGRSDQDRETLGEPADEEIDTLECVDMIFSYGAIENLQGPQLDAINDYANSEE